MRSATCLDRRRPAVARDDLVARHTLDRHRQVNSMAPAFHSLEISAPAPRAP
jgi:hypothetical protein